MNYFIRPGVVTTPTIIETLEAIDPFTHGVILDVTSGLRTPEQQLSIIGKYAVFHSAYYAEYEPGNVYDRVLVPELGRKVYRWQRVWSKLLNLGIIINPPLAAEALDGYIRDGVNKIGQLIQGSPHYSGQAFDLSGGPRGALLRSVENVLFLAKHGGAPIRRFLVERQNNAIHVDCAVKEPTKA